MGRAIRKTTIEIDDRLIKEASTILHTRGIKATIDEALRRVIAQEARESLLRRMSEPPGDDLDLEEGRRRAWQR
jgi:Arc/MetJ family transcription regulator